nr:NTP transferase domain-containing protein [Nakamurella flava]
MAAGSGRRYGTPKALVDTGDGPWVLRALAAVEGLPRRLVVVGAAGDEVTALLPDGVVAVDNPDHRTGLGSSLRAGLAAAADDPDTTAVLVLLVDLPDVGRPVVRRVLDVVADAADPSALLARATFLGRPGHPVVLGRDHWAGAAAAAVGDTGANGYLRRHPVRSIECGDLAGGADVDRPAGIR